MSFLFLHLIPFLFFIGLTILCFVHYCLLLFLSALLSSFHSNSIYSFPCVFLLSSRQYLSFLFNVSPRFSFSHFPFFLSLTSSFRLYPFGPLPFYLVFLYSTLSFLLIYPFSLFLSFFLSYSHNCFPYFLPSFLLIS